MKKVKISMNECNYYSHVFRCGYCDLDNILQDYPAQFYNCGVYGWNCDIYVDPTHDLIITTGYRNMRGDRIPSELLSKYNALMNDRQSYEEIEEIRKAFFEELAQL